MASIFGAHASETPGEIGMAGINWDTRIMPIKIGNQTEEEMDVPNSLHVAMAKALEYVGLRKQMGDNIIALNMSLTFDGRGRLEDNIRLQKLFDPIFDELRNQHEIVLLGGAGNWGDDPGVPVYPCRNTDVFCATCVGYYHQAFEYSQFGERGLPFDQENVDLCAFGATTSWCGVNSPHGEPEECLIDSLGNVPLFPQLIVASSETTHRPFWSLCGDVDCPPGYCDQGVFDELTPVWGVSPFFTSGATAQLSGLVGLVADVFPDFGPDEIEAKILASVDDVYHANPTIPVGLLGAGVTNAWKSVTRWGPLASSDLWAGDVWISGDITVPAGMELTIAAGTTVHVAFDDVLTSGPDAAHTEIIVDGTLTCLGTQAAPVTFRIIGDDPTHEWGPIVVRGTGGTPSVRLEHCVFEDMTSFLTVDLQSGGADIHISGCQAYTSRSGLVFQPASGGSSLTLLNSSFSGNGGVYSFVGVEILSGGVINPTVVLDGLTIDGYTKGLSLDAGDQTTINSVDVLTAGVTGIQLASTLDSQPNQVGHARVHSAGSYGVVVLSGISSVQHADVLSSDGYGILQVSTDAVAYDDVSVDDCQFAGMHLVSPVAGTVITNSNIVNSGSDGIRAQGGSLEVGAGTQVHTPGQIGINADGADIVIHDTVISYCEGGAQASNNGSLVIADTIFSHCYFGVSAQTTATADLSAGGAYFGPISGYFIMNGNQNETIQAQYNCFEGIIPPMGRKFIGLGPIIYTPSTCQ